MIACVTIVRQGRGAHRHGRRWRCFASFLSRPAAICLLACRPPCFPIGESCIAIVGARCRHDGWPWRWDVGWSGWHRWCRSWNGYGCHRGRHGFCAGLGKKIEEERYQQETQGHGYDANAPVRPEVCGHWDHFEVPCALTHIRVCCLLLVVASCSDIRQNSGRIIAWSTSCTTTCSCPASIVAAAVATSSSCASSAISAVSAVGTAFESIGTASCSP